MSVYTNWALVSIKDDCFIIIDNQTENDDSDIINSELNIYKKENNCLSLNIEYKNGSKSSILLKTNEHDISILSKHDRIPIIDLNKYYSTVINF